MTADPHALLAALADDVRLRAFAHVLLRPGTSSSSTAGVAEILGMREKDCLKLLTRLESVGLVERVDRHWVARPEALRDAAAAASAERESVDHGARDPEAAAVLRTFLPQGRLDQLPASRNKRLVVLDHIARVFEPGTQYTEQDVNVMLRAFHPDYAAIRRYLVDEGFLAREHGTYWRSGGTVDV